jgi:tetratricopeptide (TPR) repeat protein/TolB-like protein/tRNA A-37 threonylcarbamoyl transferase component Bud32
MIDPKSSSPNRPAPNEARPADDDQTLSGIIPGEKRQTASFSPDDVLAGRFKVMRFIARGGMGEVYEAEDQELNERVALKTVRFEMAHREHAIERFKREIQLARKVTHPNVCRTFDVFRHADDNDSDGSRETLIVSMELLSGETLEHRIRRKGRLSPEEALPLLEQMAEGLHCAHQAGVIHRDFKSSNVMLSASAPSASSIRTVITDFGLAHAVVSTGESLTGSLDVLGTPAYMAPEQLEGGKITPATDIYTLGIVIYEMLTGKLPFSGDSALSTALKRLSMPAPSPRLLVPELESRWESTVMRCLARAPEDRFSNTRDVVRALHGEEVKTFNWEGKSGPRKGRLALAAAAVLILVVLGFFSYRLMRNRAQTTMQVVNNPATTAGKARTSVAVLGFLNLSEQKRGQVLGDMLTDSLWSQLDTDQLRFIAPASVDEMKHNMGFRDFNESPGKEQLAKIGEYLGCDVLVTGSYRIDAASQPAKVEWNIHLVRARDDESLGSVQQTGTESEINAMAARAGRLVRTKLGIELNPSEEARIDSSLSANSEALRYFSEAREKQRDFDILAATKLLEKAVAADASFAQAHSALAEAWSDLGFELKAQEEAKKALDLSTRLSPESRGLIAGRYYEMNRDGTKAIQQYASLWTLYSDNPEYGLLLAKSQIAAGKAQGALATLEQVRSRGLPAGIDARAYLTTADAQEALTNYREQLKAAGTAADKARALKAGLLLARARIQQCWALLNLGQPVDAKPVCEEARRLNQEAGDQLGSARATNDIANAYWQQGDGAAAKPLYEQALGIAQTIGDKLDEAGALNNLANIEGDQGYLEGARKAYLGSIQVARVRGDKSGLALAQQNLGALYYRLGDRKNGSEMFKKASQLAREIGDKKTEARVLNNLCMFSLEAGEIQQALKSCQDSLKLRTEMGDKGDVARSLMNTGDVLMAKADLAGAKQDYLQALKIQEELGQKDYAAYTRTSLSIQAAQEKEFSEAKNYAEQAAAELNAEKDKDGEGQARTAQAEALRGLRDLTGARQQIQQAEKLAQDAKDQSLKLRAAIVRAKIDADAGKMAEAMEGLQSAEKEAHGAGLLATEFQARLALGDVKIRAGRSAEGQALLRALAQDAKAKGFELVAFSAGGVATKAMPE